MTTKKPAALAHRIADAEREHLEAVETARTELSEVHELISVQKSAIEEAQEHLAEVRAGIRRGDPDLTAATKRAATDDLEAAQDRLDGLLRRLGQVEKRASGCTQTDAALGAVALAESVWPGVPVLAACAPVPPVEPGDVPVIVLRQMEDTELDTGGVRKRQRGMWPGLNVTATFYGTSAMREVNREVIERALRSMDAKINFAHATRIAVPGGIVATEVRLVVGEPAPVPVIVRTDSAGGSNLATDVGRNIAACKSMVPIESAVDTISESVDDHGIRTMLVTGTSDLEHAPLKSFRGALDGMAPGATLRGKFVPGLGRVVSVDVEGSSGRYRWSVALTSRTGHDVPHPEVAETHAA